MNGTNCAETDGKGSEKTELTVLNILTKLIKTVKTGRNLRIFPPEEAGNNKDHQ